jgi:hypothetical protein
MKGLKTGGRTKGSKNRTSEEVRTALLKLLDDNLKTLQSDFNSMKGRDRATLLINLAKHCTPPAVNPAQLTDDQLKQVINYLQNEYKK